PRFRSPPSTTRPRRAWSTGGYAHRSSAARSSLLRITTCVPGLLSSTACSAWPPAPGQRGPGGSGRMIDHQPGPAPIGADLRCPHRLTPAGAAWRKWPPAAAGAVLIVGSALAFALDGPVAQAAYQQGLDPATFGFWRASAGALVLGGCLAARPRAGARVLGACLPARLRPGARAGIWRMRRPAAIRLALAAVAGLGLNLALFEAFARLPVAVAVAAFGCYPVLVAAWEAASRHRSAGAVRLGLAAVAVIGLVLLIRPNPSVSVPAA